MKMEPNALIKRVNPEVVPPTKKARSLTTVGHCRSELATIYKMAKEGQIELSDATKFTYILVALGKMIEAGELERRIDEIENQLGGGSGK